MHIGAGKDAMTKQSKPIELYNNATPNGRKITIMLEELSVPYNIHYIWFSRRMQFAPEFTAISPNQKIPAIIDPEGPGGEPISIFESGAILKYLAIKFGRLYPDDLRRQVKVDEWLFWQVGGFGPFLGQAHHFIHDAKQKIPYAIKRYKDEAARLYTVLNGRLEGRNWVADDYSIADIAIFGWAHRHRRHEIDLPDYPNVERWYEAMLARPAVIRGLEAAKEPRPVAEATP
jgi:GSH-dependent disulfide-bond oxidoreductase